MQFHLLFDLFDDRFTFAPLHQQAPPAEGPPVFGALGEGLGLGGWLLVVPPQLDLPAAVRLDVSSCAQEIDVCLHIFACLIFSVG